MLSTLIARLAGFFKGAATPQAPPAPRTITRSVPPVPPAVQAPPPQAETVGMGARRPLVGSDGAIAGFEFHADLRRGLSLDDPTIQRARTLNVLGAMRLCIQHDLVALAELPARTLASLDDSAPITPGMYLTIERDALFAHAEQMAALCARLRQAGARVGWRPVSDDTAPMPPGRPDFLRLPPPVSNDNAGWRALVRATGKLWPGVPQVVLDLPDIDTLEGLLGPAVLFAACTHHRASSPAIAQALPPQAHRLLRLLNQIVGDADHHAIVSDIKADAALSLRLLQHMNSPGVSVGKQLESIDHAVSLMGRAALYRWVSQMLVKLAPPRPAINALQALALARARLLELLARAANEPNPGSLYLLGLVSMLPLLLQCSASAALASLQLPQAAVDALRDRRGPWMGYLGLLEPLERCDWQAAESLAQPFGGLDTVLALHAEAWKPA